MLSIVKLLDINWLWKHCTLRRIPWDWTDLRLIHKFSYFVKNKKSPVFTLFVFFAESWPEVDYQRLATQGRWRSDRLLSDGPEQFWHRRSRHGLAKEREEAKPGHPHGFGWKQMWPRTLQVVTITKTILMETRERGWWQGGSIWTSFCRNTFPTVD